MHTPKERLVTAQWMLERQLQWIGAADVKVGVVIAVDTAMLGGLAAAFASIQDHTIWANLFCVVTLFIHSVGLLCSAFAVFPRLNGPPDSLLFFGKVAVYSPVEYTNKIVQVTDEVLLLDWTTQIHRNAMIAKLKHGWVKTAMVWSFASTPF